MPKGDPGRRRLLAKLAGIKIGLLEESDHSYKDWLHPLSLGRSPHANPVTIQEVPSGWTGEVPKGVKAYWTGKVKRKDPYFTIYPRGLVIVNSKPDRVVYICRG